MELDGLFTSPKWDIIEKISLEPLSPMQLAEKLNTSIANMSQQLRLLEVAGLVKKKKVSERAKGKPRVMFSLSEDFCYLVAASDGFAKKKLLKLEKHHNFILRTLIVEESHLHEELLEFYFRIKPYLEKVAAVYVKDKLLVLVVKAGYNGPKEFAMVRNLKLSIEESKKAGLEGLGKAGANFLFLGTSEGNNER
jgi:DNA-binding transcriptional regulator GbsR (MarR family)